MRKIVKFLLAIAAVIILAAAGGMFYLTRGLAAGSRIAVGDVDPAALSDGVFTGQYAAGRWSNTVQVTVNDGRITGIEVVKDVAFPKPEVTEEIRQRVLTAQTTTVDAVTGATVTSKAYLKAIENALQPE